MIGRNSGCGKGQGCGSGQGFSMIKRNCSCKKEPDKKEMSFAPRIAGKAQGHTHKTVKDHAFEKTQKDPENGKDSAKNLRKGEDAGIKLKEPVRAEALKMPMTDAEKANIIIGENALKNGKLNKGDQTSSATSS